MGVVHKTDNLIIVSMGHLRIVTDDGTAEVRAGDTITCKAGTKNAVWALENSRWTNLLPNPENITDTAQLVERLTLPKRQNCSAAQTTATCCRNAAQKGAHNMSFAAISAGIAGSIVGGLAFMAAIANNHKPPPKNLGTMPRRGCARTCALARACRRTTNKTRGTALQQTGYQNTFAT